MTKDFDYKQPNNPTDKERHQMVKIALEQANRLEDFENIMGLLSPPPDITTIATANECKGVTVGIIGGGVAGLASAFELRKLGFDITIFESQAHRVGGRVYTYYFNKERTIYGELGAMRIPVVHETTWHYINLFGLNTRPFIHNNEKAFLYIRNNRARNDSAGKEVKERIYPDFNLTEIEQNTSWQNLLDNALNAPLLNMSPSVRKEILQIKEKYSEQIEYEDSFSIRKVLETMGLSEGAIEVLTYLSLLGSFYNNSFSESLQESYTVDVAYRYEIVGGLVNLPCAFYNSFKHKKPKQYANIDANSIGNVHWKNGTTVTGIYKTDTNNGVTIEYKDEKSSQINRQSFDFVICAIPFSSLRNVEILPMFTPEKMQAIFEVSYCSAQKTLLKCNHRFWETKDGIIGGASYTDLPITSIWYPSTRSSHTGVLLASYNLTQDAIRLGNLPNKTRLRNVKRQVEAVHGLPKGYLNSIVEDTKSINWDSEEGFYGAFCYFTPDQKRLFSYTMIQPEYNNRVYFAGEHVSSTHAWQQGSLHSAMQAANAIAKRCKEIK